LYNFNALLCGAREHVGSAITSDAATAPAATSHQRFETMDQPQHQKIAAPRMRKARHPTPPSGPVNAESYNSYQLYIEWI
jgi:hypothetical protein